MDNPMSEQQPQGTKIFVGGLSWDTKDEDFYNYFTRFGEIADAKIMRSREGDSRGFGFVTLVDPVAADKALESEIEIDGRRVDCKRAVPKTELENQNGSSSDIYKLYMNTARTKKIFIGGLPPEVDDEELRRHFGQYGYIFDCVVMVDKHSNRSRGFGFVEYDNEESVDKVFAAGKHIFHGKQADIKRAIPKDAMPSRGKIGRDGNFYDPYSYRGHEGFGYRGGRGGRDSRRPGPPSRGPPRGGYDDHYGYYDRPAYGAPLSSGYGAPPPPGAGYGAAYGAPRGGYPPSRSPTSAYGATAPSAYPGYEQLGYAGAYDYYSAAAAAAAAPSSRAAFGSAPSPPPPSRSAYHPYRR